MSNLKILGVFTRKHIVIVIVIVIVVVVVVVVVVVIVTMSTDAASQVAIAGVMHLLMRPLVPV